MKNFILIKWVLLVIFSFYNCGNGSNHANENMGNLGFNERPLAESKIISTPIFLEDSKVVAAAFLLPSEWESNGKVSTYINYTLQIDLQLRLQNNRKGLQIIYGNTPTYIDSNVNYPLVESIGYKAPNLADNPDLNAYFEENVIPQLDKNWQFISQENISNSIYRTFGSVECEVYHFQSVQNPNARKDIFLKKTTQYFGDQGNTWNIEQIMVDGNHNHQKEGDEVAKLVLSTMTLNPVFVQYCTQTIQNMTEANRRLYENTMRLNREASDYFFTTLHSIQAKSNSTLQSTSEQFSDMMLGVTTYQLPNRSNEIKLPSTLEFTYTNNLGDFVSTDNPLFDPNSGLESIHNWELLQKKYQ